MEVGQVLSSGKIESLKLRWNKPLLPNKIVAFRAEKIPFENGAWPAFWLTAATGTWGKTGGEIDLFESVNGLNKGVITTMHTPPHCIMKASVGGKST